MYSLFLGINSRGSLISQLSHGRQGAGRLKLLEMSLQKWGTGLLVLHPDGTHNSIELAAICCTLQLFLIHLASDCMILNRYIWSCWQSNTASKGCDAQELD